MTDSVPRPLAALALLACLAAPLVAAEAPKPPAEPPKEPAHKPDARPKHSIALDAAVALALQRNLDLAVAKFNPKVASAVVVEERALFDPAVYGEYFRRKVNQQTTSVIFGERDQSWSGKGGIRKTFKPGATVDLFSSWQKQWNDTDPLFQNINPRYDQEMGVEITQPLLRGFGVTVNTAAIATARNEQRRAFAALHDIALGIVGDTTSIYWELVFAVRNRQNVLESLERARNLQRDIQARVDARVLGARDPSVAQAAAEVATREEEMVQADDAIRDAEEQLKVVTDLIADPQLWDVALIPTTEPPPAIPAPDADKAIETALAQRPDYLQARIDIDNGDINVRTRRNQLLPQLNLSAKAISTGLGYRWAGSRYEVGTLDHYDMSVALTFEYPLGNRAAHARYRRAKLARQQARVSLRALERRIQLEVRSAVRTVQTNTERLRASRLSVAAGDARLRAELIRFQDARVGTSQDVLDAQAALADAKSRADRALIDLNQSLVNVERAKGTLLEASRITLEDEAADK